jgi:hypothetical protein
MNRQTYKTHVDTCPYTERHVKCEVKECEECMIFTEFSRQPSEKLSEKPEMRVAVYDYEYVESEQDQ